MHCAYLLRGGSKSYIGYTIKPWRRLRQHNGEISGGAKATRKMKGQAAMVVCVYPFVDRRTALQYEWHWKRQRARGASARVLKLITMFSCDRWTKTAIPLKKHPPLTLWWFDRSDMNAFLDASKSTDFNIAITHKSGTMDQLRADQGKSRCN